MASKVNLDISEKLNITCRRGDTFKITLTLKDSDGNAVSLVDDGYEFLMQVRSGKTSKGKLILGTEAKGATAKQGDAITNFTFVTDNSGNVTITASDSVMRKIPAGRYIYDLQQIVNSETTTILEGSFVVNDDISKIEE